MKVKWARADPVGYECSSQGDKRFSALSAKLPDGRTIEEAYQLDVKGYRAVSDDWRAGKGKPPLQPMTPDESWAAYKALWQQWAQANPDAMADLRKQMMRRPAAWRVLNDRFATTVISQARALAEILTEEA